jgi:hypothetical protein
MQRNDLRLLDGLPDALPGASALRGAEDERGVDRLASRDVRIGLAQHALPRFICALILGTRSRQRGLRVTHILFESSDFAWRRHALSNGAERKCAQETL